MKRNGSRACVTRKTRFGSRERDWLKGDAQRGCVCLYGATEVMTPGPQTSSTTQPDLRLVLCSTSTTVEELCAQRHGQGLYLQLHGDLIR
ncbi:PH domain leucine-rich repeat-containing protein phosphatase 2 isoform X1 [Tachysurus ichikawai]